MLLSVDEAASIHEPLSNRVEKLFGAEHLAASWILPGMVFVGIVGIVYWRFVWSLPGSLLWTVVGAGAIFVVAALGLDEIASQLTDRTGRETVGTMALANLEELLEMGTSAVFVFVLLRYRDSLEPAPDPLGLAAD